MPLPFLASGLMQAGGGLIGAIGGLFQKHQANKILNGLTYPTESMPNEISQNQRIAQGMASGMPSEQYNQAMNNIQQQQMTALRGAQDRRSGYGMVSNIQNNTNQATGQLNSQNAQMAFKGKQALMGANSQSAQWQDKLYENNKLNPYMQKWNYGNSLLGAGNQNLFGGLDKITAGAGMAFMPKSYGMMGSGMYGGGGGYQ